MQIKMVYNITTFRMYSSIKQQTSNNSKLQLLLYQPKSLILLYFRKGN